VTGVASAAKAGTLRALGAEALPALARLVRPGGRLVPIVATLPQMLGAGRLGRRHGIRVLTGVAPERAEDLATLVGMAAEGRFAPLIGARFPLERIGEAHALADSGHKRGSVLVAMG
jgi:NADPH:quinone reductase-like Zn-dependent oxidoreductase